MVNRIRIPLIVCLTFVLGMSGAQGAVHLGGETANRTKIHPVVQAELSQLNPDEMITVIVTIQDDSSFLPDTGAGQIQPAEVAGMLQERAEASQGRILRTLQDHQAEGSVGKVVQFWIFNGLSVTAQPEVIYELAAHPDVMDITPDRLFQAPSIDAMNAGEGESTASLNLSAVHAPALWDLGFRGQNVVVASLDTGVSIDHPALKDGWRGGENSWFDPSGQHPDTPTDMNGHGTWTMGVMVARSSGDRPIGVAPEAKWIAAKVFNDQNQGTTTAIHQAFQWLLDPDGNPATDDAPDVVNNSWSFQTPGCFLEFQPDLQALLAAGILPIFSAGNIGPGERTSVSPANYPEALAVGAVDTDSVISPVSSRGYSSCDEDPSIYPEVVAPGINIYSTGLLGSFTQASGTSLAAPHATGSLALLLSAYPALTVKEQRAVLVEAAHDLGNAGPDNHYGYGELDVLAAFNSLYGSSAGPAMSVRSFLPLAAGGR